MASGSADQLIVQALAYWRLVVKYKWYILVGTFTLTLLFTVIIAKLPSLYEATTTILVNPQQVPEKYVTAVVSSEPYSRLNTITQQVLSRSRLQEIIDKFNLYSERRKSLSPEELIDEMRNDITIQVKQGSGPELSTFTLTYVGREPGLVAQVANELATSFIRWNITSRGQQVTGTQDFLSSELEAARQNLQQQEDKLLQFKMRHLGETPDQTATNFQAISGLRSALEANTDSMSRLDEQRILLARLAEMTSLTTSPNGDTTDRGRLQWEKQQLETTIQQLREHHSERYPDVVRANSRLDEISAQLESLSAIAPSQGSNTKSAESLAGSVRLEVIDREMKRLQSEQNQIQSQIADYQGKVAATPLLEQKIVELTRNYDISKQHYQTLLESNFNIGMAADLEQRQKAERFTVLDLAQVPQKPVKPRRKLFIPLSSFVAIGLSIFVALVKETINPAVKSEMELKSLLPTGVRITGLIPRIEITSDARRDLRLAIYASVVCFLLCLTLAGVIWEIRSSL
jgi:polysaccharide chain length determinant protein (PEP-CTERM system associated)